MVCNGVKSSCEGGYEVRRRRQLGWLGFHTAAILPHAESRPCSGAGMAFFATLGRANRDRYNPCMQSHRYMPDATRVSVLTSMVLLAFALTHVINTPVTLVSIPLAGKTFQFNLQLNTSVTILTAILAAAGVAWLLRGHPSIQPGETAEHWLLPMLTVLIIGVTLSTLSGGIVWWLGFGLGAGLLVLVFLAEYVVVDPSDVRYPLATAALTALAFALALILTVALRATDVTLLILAPALFLGQGLVALRALHLRLNERWDLGWASGIGLIGMQMGSALRFWPLTPVQFGLILLGPVYALTMLAVSLSEGHPFRQAMVEPLVMLILVWGLAFLFH